MAKSMISRQAAQSERSNSPLGKGQEGFSLVEVLVALAVFATAGLSLGLTVTQAARNASLAQSRALAVLVAENQIAEILSQQSIRVQKEKTQIRQLSDVFWVESKIEATEINQILKVEIVVRVADGAEKNGQILATRTALTSTLEYK